MYFLGVIPKRVNEYFCTVKLVINFETLIKCAKNYAQRVNEILNLRIIDISGFLGTCSSLVKNFVSLWIESFSTFSICNK